MTDETRKNSKNGWRTVRFGDVVRNVDSSVKNPLEQGIERFVGLEHLDPESLHVKRWGNVADGTSFSRKFASGQVLFGKRRAYQRKAAVADFEGICSGDILVFEPKADDLLPELLPFVVQSDGFFEHALSTSAGSLSPRTKWSDMARYEFALPPKDEQRRIAEILSSVDDVINKNLQITSNTESLKNLIATQLWKLRKNESFRFSLNPSDWIETKLGSICDKIQDGTHFSPKTTEGDFRYVTSKNIKDGFLDVTNCGWISQEEHENIYRRCDVKFGDVLLTKDGANTGNVALNNLEEPFSLLSSVALLRPKKNVLDNYYLFEFLKSGEGRYSITSQMKGTAITRVTLQQIKNIEIPLPPFGDQQRVAEILTAASTARDNASNNVANAKEVKKNLLNQFFNQK